MQKTQIWNVNEINDLTDKVLIITGSTSGIGKEAVRILAENNARVVMAVRNIDKAKEVLHQIKNRKKNASIDIIKLDLTSLKSVEEFAKEFKSRYNRLDVLINNAGIMMPALSRTEDGFEIQMGTNHFGHFALTGHLLPVLYKTKASRIVVTASIAHKMGSINFSDINWKNRKYNTVKAYADSKLANLYFAYELGRKLQKVDNAPIVTASHPGITATELQRYSGLMSFFNAFAQTADIGILPSLRAAFDPKANQGHYYGPSGLFEFKGYPVKVESNRKSHNVDEAKLLWDISEKLTGVKY